MSGSEKSLTIGRLAARAGVGVETIRFYQRKELVSEPPKPATRYRRYPPETASRIRFIRRAKGLGFSLAEIQDLLSLRIAPGVTREDVRHRAESKIEQLENKIATLQHMKAALSKLTDACRRETAPDAECPILQALDTPGASPNVRDIGRLRET